MKENPGKRQALLEAASRLFSRRGYAQTSMRDIAAEAGVAVGTTYLYFPTKDDLLEGIYQHSSSLLLERITDRLSGLDRRPEKLHAFLQESVDFSFDHPEFFLILFVDLRRSEVEFPQRPVFRNFQKYIDLLRGILTEGHARGEFRQPASPALLLGIMGFWVAIVLHAVIGPSVKDPETRKREVLEAASAVLEPGLLRPTDSAKENP